MKLEEKDVTPDHVFVFWSYDMYPYMLGALTDMTKRQGSKYYVPAYQGSVRPFAVLDGLAGWRLMRDLEQMREDRRAADNQTAESFRRMLTERLKKDDITHPNKYVNEGSTR